MEIGCAWAVQCNTQLVSMLTVLCNTYTIGEVLVAMWLYFFGATLEAGQCK